MKWFIRFRWVRGRRAIAQCLKEGWAVSAASRREEHDWKGLEEIYKDDSFTLMEKEFPEEEM